MKKILAILLALTCAVSCMFVLSACNDDVCTEHVDNDGDKKCDVCQADMSDPAGTEDKRTAFSAAIAATKPTTLKVTVKSNSPFGELESVYTTVYSTVDSSFTITYHTKQINDGFEVDADIIEKDGVITCDASGNYSDGTFMGSNPNATGVNANIMSDRLTNYTVSTDGNILTATIAADDTLAVLGVQYAEDVTLVLTKNEGKIISISLTYGAEANRVKVACVYN